MPECYKCPYFVKKKIAHSVGILTGFCTLRQLYIPEKTINNVQCKDKAYINLEGLKPIAEVAKQIKEKSDKQFVTF